MGFDSLLFANTTEIDYIWNLDRTVDYFMVDVS